MDFTNFITSCVQISFLLSVSFVDQTGSMSPNTTEFCYGKNSCILAPDFAHQLHTSCNCRFDDYDILVCIDDFTTDIRNLNKNESRSPFQGSTELSKLLVYIGMNSQCRTIITTKGDIKTPIIDACPIGYYLNNRTKARCELETRLPLVRTNSVLRVVYQNIYCFICHRDFYSNDSNDQLPVDSYDQLEPWPARIECTEGNFQNWAEIEDGMASYQCQRRYYRSHIIKRLPGLQFKSILMNECSKCLLTLSLTNNSMGLECLICRLIVNIIRGNGGTFDDDSIIDTGLVLLFKLRQTWDAEIEINGGTFNGRDVCKDNEEFDVLFGKCRQIVCGFGQYALKGHCIDNETAIMLPYSQPMPNGTQVIEFTLRLPVRHTLEEYIMELLNSFRYTFWTFRQEPELKLIDKNISEISFTLLRVKSDFKDLIKFLVTEKFNSISGNVNMKLSISNFPNTDNLIEFASCPAGLKWRCFKNSMVYFVNDFPYAKIVDDASSRSLQFPLDNIYFDMRMDSLEYGINLTDVCVCFPREKNLSCSYSLYRYMVNEIKIQNDGKLKILHHHLEFEESEFYIQNGTATVCYNPNKSRSFFKLDLVQAYLSWTCTGLSILCLIITIIFYSIFDELRNLPGKIIIALSACLILGQGLLIIPDLGVGICKYIAAVSHFMWLSAFLWMSCQAVNLFFTFHPKTLQSVDSWKNSQTFTWYLLVCLSIPFIIVSTCFVLDMIPGDHLHVMYGLISCSWMSQNSGIIYAFFVPVGITLVTNVICFSLALHYIEQTMANSEKVTGRRRDRSRCIIYMKLSAVMGFSWIIGFVASFFDVNILWYVYIVLNGLQGVFIFLGFGFNARVRNIISARMSSMTTFSNLFYFR